jgi:hypothetical protein
VILIEVSKQQPFCLNVEVKMLVLSLVFFFTYKILGIDIYEHVSSVQGIHLVFV